MPIPFFSTSFCIFLFLGFSKVGLDDFRLDFLWSLGIFLTFDFFFATRFLSRGIRCDSRGLTSFVLDGLCYY